MRARVRGRGSLQARTSVFAYTLLLPAFALIALFVAYPLYVAVNVSLRSGRGLSLADVAHRTMTLQNYAEMAQDPATWQSLWLSVVYTLGATIPAFAIGLGTALLLNQRFPGRRWFRTAILLPWPVPGVVAAITFLWMMDGSYGVVNYALRATGLISENVAWFFRPDTAMFAVIVPTVWKAYPFFTIVILAALQSIPPEMYEAARVDGCTAPALFRWITWPFIKMPAVLGLVLTGLWVFREFDFIYAITRGGPSGATETLAIRIYNEAFRFYNLSYAATLGLLALLVAALVVLAIFPQLKRDYL
jgi:multiple sugar transport system permease protein